jgi:AraC-like DNA-binding protein
MKPALIRIRHTDTSIDFDDKEYPYFYNPWHYHPEIEIVLILESFGQLFVGDKIENFSEGDLVCLGSNLPHVWKNDKSFYQEGGNGRARAIVIKFLPDFAGKELLNREEMQDIKQLLMEKAGLGLKLKGCLKSEITTAMREFKAMNDAGKIIQLLKMLNLIANSTEYTSLASPAYINFTQLANEKDNLRINVILEYLAKNHNEQIDLNDVAGQIHMNKNAFCRFFKQKTGKSMVQLLSEIRIGKACQRLQRTEESVDRISAYVGFNNISNFNRAFKMIMGTTPLVYRKHLTNLR